MRYRDSIMISNSLLYVTVLTAVSGTLISHGVSAETQRSPVELPPFVITGHRDMGPSVNRLDMEAVKQSASGELGDALSEVPGVSGVRRGACGAESVIRGQGWERVAVQVDGLPLYGACPARMDPPLVYVSKHAAESVSVEKGLPSVTWGPGGTAGRVLVSPHYVRDASAKAGVESALGVSTDTARDGYDAHAELKSGSDTVSARATVDVSEGHDYRSANGVRVPAHAQEHGASLSLGLKPTSRSQLWTTLQYHRGEDVNYPALPMDTREMESTILNGRYQVDLDKGGLERIELKLGYASVDHLMDNRDKSNRGKLHASTRSEARSIAATALGEWRLGEQTGLTVGVDANHAERDAMRTRIMIASGMRFQDHMWPEPEQDAAGLFGEVRFSPRSDWTFRLGSRVDVASSDASAADAAVRLGPGIAPTTVRDAYVRFNGSDAADDSVTDVMLAGNVVALWQATDAFQLYTSLGRVTRAPNLTERYFAYAPAPGGYQVGNPALDPEAKHEVDVGFEYNAERLRLACSLFAARVEDYIYNSVVDRFDVNGDGTPDRIRGFENLDATFMGGELSGDLNVASGLTLPFSVAYVRGRNETDNRDLPEIPPLDLRLAVRLFGTTGEHRWWSEFGARYADSQNHVDPLFPEDATPDFSVFHLRAGVKLAERVELTLGVENLFDNDYHEHLTREAMLGTGDLAKGSEIPEPGRYLHASVRTTF